MPTLANISALQIALGADNVGITAIQWTLLKLAITGVSGTWKALRLHNLPYLVVAWAALGISQKQVATPEVARAASLLALVAFGLVLLLVFCSSVRQVGRLVSTGLSP